MINLSCNWGETLPVTMNISKLRTVRARCVQLPPKTSSAQQHFSNGCSSFGWALRPSFADLVSSIVARLQHNGISDKITPSTHTWDARQEQSKKSGW